MRANVIEKLELQPLQNFGEFALIIRLDEDAIEFANELGTKAKSQSYIVETAKRLICEKYPFLKVTICKLVVGGIVVCVFPLSSPTASASSTSENSRVTIPTVVHAPISTNSPTIMLDGQVLQTQAVIINGSTFVPIRIISESLGATVGWENSSRTVTIEQSGTRISFVVGSTIANVNGKQVTTPASMIIDGSTMVPVRFVSETLGLDVEWEDKTRTVILRSPQQTTTQYTVVAGDTLWTISRKFALTIDEIRRANNLNSDILRVNQTLVIPQRGTAQILETTTNSNENTPTSYTVVAGDHLSGIASRFGITVQALRSANNLQTDILQVGQRLMIPNGSTTVTPTPSQTTAAPVTHTVVAGDSLWTIASRYGVTVDSI